MSIEGLFFDFDGVIADTETCWVQTIVSYCAARGIALDRRTLYSYLGDGDVQMLRYLGMCCGAAPEALLADLRPLFRQKTEQLTLRPGIRTYIKYAQEQNLRLALVSNSTAPYISRWLNKLGLRDVFSCVVTRTPEVPGKPRRIYILRRAKDGACRTARACPWRTPCWGCGQHAPQAFARLPIQMRRRVRRSQRALDSAPISEGFRRRR